MERGEPRAPRGCGHALLGGTSRDVSLGEPGLVRASPGAPTQAPVAGHGPPLAETSGGARGYTRLAVERASRPGAVAVGGVVVPHLRFLSTLARSAGNGSAPATWQAPCEAPRSPRAVTPMAVTVTTVGPMPCRTLFPRLRTSRTVSGRRGITQVCCRYGRRSGWAAATSVRSRGGAAAPGGCHLPRVSRAAQHQAANGEPSLGPASEEQGRVPARPPIPEENSLPTRTPPPWEAFEDRSRPGGLALGLRPFRWPRLAAVCQRGPWT